MAVFGFPPVVRARACVARAKCRVYSEYVWIAFGALARSHGLPPRGWLSACAPSSKHIADSPLRSRAHTPISADAAQLTQPRVLLCRLHQPFVRVSISASHASPAATGRSPIERDEASAGSPTPAEVQRRPRAPRAAAVPAHARAHSEGAAADSHEHDPPPLEARRAGTGRRRAQRRERDEPRSVVWEHGGRAAARCGVPPAAPRARARDARRIGSHTRAHTCARASTHMNAPHLHLPARTHLAPTRPSRPPRHRHRHSPPSQQRYPESLARHPPRL
jgi:hypothetical protein